MPYFANKYDFLIILYSSKVLKIWNKILQSNNLFYVSIYEHDNLTGKTISMYLQLNWLKVMQFDKQNESNSFKNSRFDKVSWGYQEVNNYFHRLIYGKSEVRRNENSNFPFPKINQTALLKKTVTKLPTWLNELIQKIILIAQSLHSEITALIRSN